MKNKELWKSIKVFKDKKGKYTGGYLNKLIGYAYEPVIKEHTKGLIAVIHCGVVPFY